MDLLEGTDVSEEHRASTYGTTWCYNPGKQRGHLRQCESRLSVKLSLIVNLNVLGLMTVPLLISVGGECVLMCSILPLMARVWGSVWLDGLSHTHTHTHTAHLIVLL
jgi:hypothetical protein